MKENQSELSFSSHNQAALFFIGMLFYGYKK
jgi:hypothetical protein